MAEMLAELLQRLPLVTVIAILGGIAVVGVCLLAIVVLNRVGIALERRPLKLVREFFRQHFPQESIAWLRLAASEPSRWVVGVFYGSTRPPRYKFFAVDRETEQITELDDLRQYAPKQWL
jgi:hypothetical protein